MQIKTLWAAARRRWYAVVATVLLAASATYLVVDAVGPTYEATGAVLVLPPSTTVNQQQKQDANGNPYLALGGLSQVRDVAIRAMTSQSTTAELCKSSSDPAYEAMRAQLCAPDPKVVFDVGPDFTNSAPIVLIKADANSAQNAEVALTSMMAQVPAVLTQLQAPLKLDAGGTITSTPLVTDTKPEVVRKDQIRIGIVTGAGVLALGLMALALLDSLLLGRSRRSGAEPDAEEGEELEGETEGGWWGQDSDASDADQEVAALEQAAALDWDDRSRQVERVGRG